jgi:hypothetical protein
MILVSEYKLFKRSNKANLFIALAQRDRKYNDQKEGQKDKRSTKHHRDN